VRVLEGWMKSYKPQELFDKDGRLVAELAALPPKGARRMSDNPVANVANNQARSIHTSMPMKRSAGELVRAVCRRCRSGCKPGCVALSAGQPGVEQHHLSSPSLNTSAELRARP